MPIGLCVCVCAHAGQPGPGQSDNQAGGSTLGYRTVGVPYPLLGLALHTQNFWVNDTGHTTPLIDMTPITTHIATNRVFSILE